MSKYGTYACLSALLSATVFALSCGDSVAPERRSLGAPDFALGGELLTATFDAGADGFSYRDDPFRGTAAPAYANGAFGATGGFSSGGLRVVLGGIDDGGVLGMSGGWTATFTLGAPEDVALTLRYQLTQSSEYEIDEYAEALVSVDGTLRGLAGTDRLARLTGDGNGGTAQTTGWQQVELTIPGLSAGTHTVVIGAYNNKKTAANETTELLIDDVAVTVTTASLPLGTTILAASFDAGPDGFTYADDPFRASAAPTYASGTFVTTGGFSGGGLRVLLGGVDDAGVLGMSGGWTTTFTLGAPEDVTLTLRYQLTQASEYESDEYSDALVSVDGILRGVAGTDRLARLTGDGNGGSPETTGWQQVELVIPGLAAGTHTVVIGAYNNKKTAANETTELLIDDVAITGGTGVTITQAPGDLTIATATTGEGQPAGYTMSVTAPDGTPFTLTFAATESKTFPGIAGGDYRLEITDMPGNCGLVSGSGTNPRTVTVDGGAASTTFEITCTATTPTSGTLMIVTATTGESQPQGYTLHIEGPGGMADPTIGATDIVTFPNVAFGDYTVEIGAVPANCTLNTANGPNPRTVTVPPGDTGRTTFNVTCTATPTTGDLTIATATTGEAQLAGYSMSVTAPDGTPFTLTFAATESKTFSGQPAGDYRLEITDMPANCGLVSGTGTNPRTVTVPAGGSASTTFQVSCTATTPPPVANFTFSCLGLTCSFDASSSTAQATATYSWSWGDGTAAGGGKTATHIYGSAGTRSVTLTVTDAGGSNSTTKSVTTVAPPVARFTFSCSGLACTFDASSSTAQANATYSWNWGDGTLAGSGKTATHTYGSAGTRSVTLTVTDAGGSNSTTKSVTVTAPNQAPSVNAGSDETVLLGLTYVQYASFSDPDNGPWSYTINWGDGASTSGTKSSPGQFSEGHKYILPGSYTIRVTVTDSRGASGSDTKVLTVLTNLGGIL